MEAERPAPVPLLQVGANRRAAAVFAVGAAPSTAVRRLQAGRAAFSTSVPGCSARRAGLQSQSASRRWRFRAAPCPRASSQQRTLQPDWPLRGVDGALAQRSANAEPHRIACDDLHRPPSPRAQRITVGSGSPASSTSSNTPNPPQQPVNRMGRRLSLKGELRGARSWHCSTPGPPVHRPPPRLPTRLASNLYNSKLHTTPPQGEHPFPRRAGLDGTSTDDAASDALCAARPRRPEPLVAPAELPLQGGGQCGCRSERRRGPGPGPLRCVGRRV